MQFLDANAIAQNLSMLEAINALEQLLLLQGQHPHWVQCPTRIALPINSHNPALSNGTHLTMPATIFNGEDEFYTAKLVSICPDNPQHNLSTINAIMVVSDNRHGKVLAIMDGTYITQIRTGALSAIATKYLASPDASSLAVIGCGAMAFEQLNAVLTVRPNINQVRLWNRTPAKAKEFAQKCAQTFAKQYPKLNFSICNELDQALENADIINLATSSNQALVEISSIKTNVHINAIGAYTPNMCEVSPSVIERCSIIVVDEKNGCDHEAGDLIQAANNPNCAWNWEQLSGSLIDVVQHKIQPKHGISLFKSVGAACFDAAVAIAISQKTNAKT